MGQETEAEHRKRVIAALAASDLTTHRARLRVQSARQSRARRSMTDLLRKLLNVRDAITAARQEAEAYGYQEALAAEFNKLDETEREIFAKVNEWDKP